MLQRMHVQLGFLSVQSVSSLCELVITVLSTHTALVIFLTFNILEKTHCLDCF